MIIYPAIDIKNGKCVRLYKGDKSKETIFNNNPYSQAKKFQDQGFKFLHLVDLDGAFEGKSINKDAINSVINSVNIPIQLGGGIRSIKEVEYWLKSGINRIILGSLLLNNFNMLKDILKEFSDRIVIALDAKNGRIVSEGWIKNSDIEILEIIKKINDLGAKIICYTNTNLDGTLEGIDIDKIRPIVESSSSKIIISGGVSSLQDIHNIKILKKEYKNINGIIIGSAIYKNKIIISELKSYL